MQILTEYYPPLASYMMKVLWQMANLNLFLSKDYEQNKYTAYG